MNPDILDKILRAIIVFLHVEKLGCTNSSWKRVTGCGKGGQRLTSKCPVALSSGTSIVVPYVVATYLSLCTVSLTMECPLAL